MKNSFVKYIKIAVACIVLLLLVACSITCYSKGKETGENKANTIIAELNNKIEDLEEQIRTLEPVIPVIDIDIINTEMKEVGELATIEYIYTDSARYSESRGIIDNKIILPFSEKSFICQWDGTIKAGIEISEVNVEVDKSKNVIIVNIPETKILSHEIDTDSFVTLDEKNGLFNRISIDDVRNYDTKNKEYMENRALENGLLEKAEENTKNVIENLIYNINPEIKKYYEIEFKTIK